MVSLIIDDREIEVEEGTTILEAARAAGIEIATLCYLKEINEVGACRVCSVEVEGLDQLVASCNTRALDGMIVHTNSQRARIARKTNVEFLLSQHDSQCTSCVRSGNCTLQTLANDLGVSRMPFTKHLGAECSDLSFPLIRENDKCVKCLRCIQICENVQATGVWSLTNRAAHTSVNVAGNRPVSQTDCTLCGQCVTHCPTGALRERDDTERVFEALADPDRICLLQIAPASRVSWGESFGLTPEESSVERLGNALRALGFDYVFDTGFSADLTIMEEASELIEHLSSDAPGPMFTSCCPGWVRFAKAHYPDVAAKLSSAKSPQQMFGAIAKTYYAESLKVDPAKIFSVSVMPCMAKKAEADLPTMRGETGAPDVDVALTVREVVRMIRAAHIDPRTLDNTPLDQPLGSATGAGVAFGSTGGVMDAALRSSYYFLTGTNPDPDAFSEVRTHDGWREVSFKLPDRELNIAVAHGLSHAQEMVEALERGEVSYDFVEVMACPGGCVGGGGQPIHCDEEFAQQRSEKLWNLDKFASLRFSHENPSIKLCYEDYLGHPLSERAEQLLHTDHSAWQMPTEHAGVSK